MPKRAIALVVAAALTPIAAPPGAALGTASAPPSGAAARADTLWLRAPTPARDAVHAGDTEAALVRRYGRAHVKRDSIPGAEGESSYGTVLFADDSARTLYVYWADARPFVRPEAVATGPGARAWTIWPGVAVGTALADVERLNGRPFRLTGFEWDYGGAVVDWRGGRLPALWAGAPNGTVSNGATPNGTTPNTAAPDRAPSDTGRGVDVSVSFAADRPAARITGEGVFSSALPAVRAARPRVAELYVRVR